MPIKDVEKNRAYQREWARRKRLGINTKIVNNHKYKSTVEEKRLRAEERRLLMTPEERNSRQEREKRRFLEKRKQLKDKLDQLLGKKCGICGSDFSFVTHEIHGIPHVGNGSDQFVDAFVRPEDFVRLCYPCHKGVHWVMKWFNMSWGEIMDKVNETKLKKGE